MDRTASRAAAARATPRASGPSSSAFPVSGTLKSHTASAPSAASESQGRPRRVPWTMRRLMNKATAKIVSDSASRHRAITGVVPRAGRGPEPPTPRQVQADKDNYYTVSVKSCAPAHGPPGVRLEPVDQILAALGGQGRQQGAQAGQGFLGQRLEVVADGVDLLPLAVRLRLVPHDALRGVEQEGRGQREAAAEDVDPQAEPLGHRDQE